jgi:hypothetical protein
MKTRVALFLLIAAIVPSLNGCGNAPQQNTSTMTHSAARPTATLGRNSAPGYQEIRSNIARLLSEIQTAYATATPSTAEADTYEKDLTAYIGGLKGKKVDAWQGWVLEVLPGPQGSYTATIDMDEFYEVEPPLGFEYRGIRLIGLTDVVLSNLSKESAEKVSAGQKVEISGTIKGMEGLASDDTDKPAVDPSVRLAVILMESKVTPLKSENAGSSLADDYKSAVITLKHPVCGMASSHCYTYNLIVYGTGKVVYTEEDWSTGQVNRTETANVSEEKVRELVAEFDKIRYFSLKDDYSSYDMSDASSATTSITLGAKRKSTFHYHGDMSAPKELSDLESKIDELYKPTEATPTISP